MYNKYIKAITKIFGKEKQIYCCIEELSELIQSICKLKRYGNKKKYVDNFIEELTDSLITLEWYSDQILEEKNIYEKNSYEIEEFDKYIKESHILDDLIILANNLINDISYINPNKPIKRNKDKYIKNLNIFMRYVYMYVICFKTNEQDSIIDQITEDSIKYEAKFKMNRLKNNVLRRE